MPRSDATAEGTYKINKAAASISSQAELDASSYHDQVQRAETARSSTNILLFLIAFRILNALCIRTFFQPDEYFQSLEPAWAIAFGEGSGAWLTWEWEHHLRSTFHPYIFALGYWTTGVISNLLQLDPALRANILIIVPKIIQAHIAACGDYYSWKLAERIYGRRSLESWACLALTVGSPWQWFCSTRTLSNCLETTLTVTALNFWPWEWSITSSDNDNLHLRQDNDLIASEQRHRLRSCLTLAAIACILRPTNVLIWACLTWFTLFGATSYDRIRSSKWSSVPTNLTLSMLEHLKATRTQQAILVGQAALCGAAVLLVSALFDWSFYKQLTFPPFKFLYFNIAKDLAVFYGRNDWHYYLSQGYPLLLTTYLPFAVIGIYDALAGGDEHEEDAQDRGKTSSSIRFGMASISLIVPFILSFIAHKEVRFIYPILPLLHVLASPSAVACIRPGLANTRLEKIETPASSTSSVPLSESSASLQKSNSQRPESRSTLSTYRPTILLMILLLNLLIAMFTTQYHQRGVLSVMDYLRHEHELRYLSQPPEIAQISPADSIMTVGFLMPCHSTPWRSHLVHPSIHAWALGCEPPVHIPSGELRETYMDEADRFYKNPRQFMTTEIGPLVPAEHQTPQGLMRAFAGSSDQEDVRHQSSTHSTILSSSIATTGSQQSMPWNGGLARKPWPDYLVFFEGLTDVIANVTHSKGYVPCWRAWNSWFHDDWRRKGDVVVFCRPK